MALVLHPLLGPVCEQLVNDEHPVLDLLLGLFGLDQDGAGLRVTIPEVLPEKDVSVLIALVVDPNDVHQGGRLQQQLFEFEHEGVNMGDVSALDDLHVEDPLDIVVSSDIPLQFHRILDLHERYRTNCYTLIDSFLTSSSFR